MLTVAVCIPTIPGREPMLERALESVRGQLHYPNQLLVDCDTERTGAARTRNRLLTRVDSDLICWLDDDDELLPNHIQRLARVLERFDRIDLVYPIPQIVGGRDPTAVSHHGAWQLPWGLPFDEEAAEHLRYQGSFIPITHAVRASAVRAVGGFPIPGTADWPRPNVEDWGYLIRLLDAGCRFLHLPVTTWVWHIHADRSLHTGGQPDR